MVDSLKNSLVPDAGRALREAESMSVFCSLHPLAALRPRMTGAGLVSAANLQTLAHGQTVKIAGLSILLNTPPTRSGQRIMFVTLEDETGLVDVVVFSFLRNRAAEKIMNSQVLGLEGRLQRQKRAISVVGLDLIPEWTGSLASLLKRPDKGCPGARRNL